jgi:hypothetical protein
MNAYGLDASYFSKKLKSILSDINNYRPNEMKNEMKILVAVAEAQEKEVQNKFNNRKV